MKNNNKISYLHKKNHVDKNKLFANWQQSQGKIRSHTIWQNMQHKMQTVVAYVFKDKICYWPAKITKFENGCLWINQEVLRLNVSMTNALGMDIGQTAEQLVHVHLRRTQRNVKNKKPVYRKSIGIQEETQIKHSNTHIRSLTTLRKRGTLLYLPVLQVELNSVGIKGCFFSFVRIQVNIFLYPYCSKW